MRPIKLVMSAFGAYADVVTIDFTRYDDRGLFLITGPTGSGKTTIFDGISFALYGMATGQHRKDIHLRSDYAAEGADTYVEFTFTHQGHTYVVRRSPSYERQKKRGVGTITQQEQASIARDGGVPQEGVETVRKELKELLAVDYSKFKQLAMIAQGEFYQLLNASTKDRTEILRSIFMTDGYKRIEENLKAERNLSSRAMQDASRSISQFFGGVHIDTSCDEPSYVALRENYLDLKDKSEGVDSGWNITRLLSAVEELADADEARAGELENAAVARSDEATEAYRRFQKAFDSNARIDEKERCEKALKALKDQDEVFARKEAMYQRHAAAVHEIKPQYDRYKDASDSFQKSKAKTEELTETLRQVSSTAESCAKVLGEAKVEEPKAAEMEASASQIEHDKTEYAMREKLDGEIRKQTEYIDSLKKDLDKACSTKESLNREIVELRQKQEELKDAPVQAEQLRNELKRTGELIHMFSELTGERKGQYDTASRELEAAQQKFRSSTAAYKTARQASEEAQILLESCRAGILAETLEDGVPCPVCGAIHHPKKAVLPQNSVTEDEVKRLEEKTEKARSRRESDSNAAAEKNTWLKSLRQTLMTDLRSALDSASSLAAGGKGEPDGLTWRDDTESLTGQDNADGLALQDDTDSRTLRELLTEAARCEETLSRKLQNENRLYERLQIDIRSLQDINKQLKEDEEHLDAAVKSADGMKITLDECEKKLAGMQGQVEALKKLPYENWEAARKVMDDLRAQAAAIRNKIQEAERQRKSADEAVAATQSALKEQTEHLKADTRKQQESEAAFHNILREHNYACEEALKADLVTEADLTRESREIRQHEQDKAAAAAKLEQAAQNAEGRQREDAAALKMLWEKLKGEAEHLSREQTLAQKRSTDNRDLYANMASKGADYEEARKTNATADRLYKLVSGQTGEGKITFEQYVQAEGFDGIIRAANRRLYRMSTGRYALLRRQDAWGKQTNTSLDLDVMDYYTGKKRPVSTLSGGESFDASLALALGLSDTISSSLGGIQIDALFVDEGFGTLDSESINSVLQTLIDLSNTSKLVGVISHRDELFEVIPQKIIVQKSAEGSRLHFDDGE